MDVYDKITALLNLRKITKKKMCEDLGIPYNTLMSLYKRKSKSMSLDMIQSIADYLGVSLELLLKNDNGLENILPMLDEGHIKKTEGSSRNIYHLSKKTLNIEKYPPEAIVEIEEFLKYIDHKYNLE